MAKEQHNKENNVLIFGAVSAIVSLITGSLLLLFLVAKGVEGNITLLGISWMVYSGLILVGIDLFEKSKKREAAWYLIVLGIVGIFLAVGFFLAGWITLFTGFLAYRYSKGLHKPF